MLLSNMLRALPLTLSCCGLCVAAFSSAEPPRYSRDQIDAARSLPTPIPMLGDFRTVLPTDRRLSAYVGVEGVWKAHNWAPDFKADKSSQDFEYSADLSVWSWNDDEERDVWQLIAKWDHHRKPQWWTFSPVRDSYLFKVNIADEYARLGELEVTDYDSGRFLARIPASGDRRTAKGNVLCSWAKTSSIRIVGLTATGKKLFELCASNGHPDGYTKLGMTSAGFRPNLPSSSLFSTDGYGSIGVVGNIDELPNPLSNPQSLNPQVSYAVKETEFINDTSAPVTIDPPKDFNFPRFRIINQGEYSRLLGIQNRGLMAKEDTALPDYLAKWFGVEDSTPVFKGCVVPAFSKGKIRWTAWLNGLSFDVDAWPERAEWYRFKKAGTIYAVSVQSATAVLSSVDALYQDYSITLSPDTPLKDGCRIACYPTIGRLGSLCAPVPIALPDSSHTVDQGALRNPSDPIVLRLRKGSAYNIAFNTSVYQSWPVNASVLGVRNLYINTLAAPKSINVTLPLIALQELKVKVLNGDLRKDGKLALYNHNDSKYFNAVPFEEKEGIAVGTFQFLSPGRYRIFVPQALREGLDHYADVVVEKGTRQEVTIDLKKTPKM